VSELVGDYDLGPTAVTTMPAIMRGGRRTPFRQAGRFGDPGDAVSSSSRRVDVDAPEQPVLRIELRKRGAVYSAKPLRLTQTGPTRISPLAR